MRTRRLASKKARGQQNPSVSMRLLRVGFGDTLFWHIVRPKSIEFSLAFYRRPDGHRPGVHL